MPKLFKTPPGLLSTQELCEFLEKTEANLRNAGLLELLNYYQPSGQRNSRKLYVKEQAAQLKYWLLVRKGLIKLGLLSAKAPLMPPRHTAAAEADLTPEKDIESRQLYLAAWFDEDPNGIECPHCGGTAVTVTYSNSNRGWCPDCKRKFGGK